MYCNSCGALVETEVVRDADPELYITDIGEMGHALGHGWFEEDEVRTRKAGGQDHGVDDIGETFSTGVTDYEVRLRVDICANCGVPIQGRIYTVIL